MARKILTSTANSNRGNLHHYNLPKGLVTVVIKQVKDGFSVSLERKIIPDPNGRYFFSYTPSAFTSDDITIEYGENGFLSKVHTLIDDQTDEFLSKIGDLSLAVAEGAIGGTKTRDVDFVDKILFSGTIDPFDPEQINRINKSIQNHKLTFSFKDLKSTSEEKETPLANRDSNGLYSRPLNMYEFALEGPDGLNVNIIELPDLNALQFIEIPNASFVKTDFEITFDAFGNPKTIHIVKPSSAMAIIEVPIKIIGALLELPAKIFKLRVDLSNEKTNSLTGEINRMKKEVDFRNEEKTYQEFVEQQREEAKAKEEAERAKKEAQTPKTRSVNPQPDNEKLWKLEAEVQKLDETLVFLTNRFKALADKDDS